MNQALCALRASRRLCRYFFYILVLLTLTPILVNADKDVRQNTEPPPASAFYRLPQYAHPQLSPSGRYLASRVVVSGKLGLLINALERDEESFFCLIVEIAGSCVKRSGSVTTSYW